MAPVTYLEPVARFSIQRSFHPELQGRANVGRYGRLPSLFERYGNTGHVLGNSDLVPEHGMNGDLGLRWDHPTPRTRTAVDLAVFGADVTDLIVFQKAGERIRPVNIKGARVLGVEAALQAQFGKHLRAVAQGTFTDARDESGRKASQGHQLPMRPRFRGYARPELRDLPIGGHLTLGAYADVDITGGNYLDGENLLRLPTRVQFGVGLHVDAPRLGVRILGKLENIANSPFYDLSGYPLPGRTFFLTLAFRSQAITKETSS
jgi:iron complex outermembrane receptor protein